MSPSPCRKLVAVVAAAARPRPATRSPSLLRLRRVRGSTYPGHSFYEETGEHASEARTK